MMSTPSRQYATDVTDAQWQQIQPLLPASRWWPNGPGRPPRDRRQIVNGLLYLTKTRMSLGVVALLFWAVENRV